MNNFKIFGLCAVFIASSQAKAAEAEWTFLTYIQADNNLWNYAYYNIYDMQVGIVDTAQVNVLIQWDQPGNNKTWRYKIVKGGKVEVDSVSQEMGVNPQQELINCASWVKSKYPAKKYAWVLWNHGSGIEDKSLRSVEDIDKLKNSWLELPGYNNAAAGKGILYDYTQSTFLSSQGLFNAFNQIKTILGKKISLLGMDACLMAMIEVIYQLKDAVEVFVGSQQTEPGYGWAYSSIIKALTSSPTRVSALQLGQAAVTAYNSFYKQLGETDYTQSAISIADLQPIKDNIDEMFSRVAECKKYKASAIKNAIISARNSAVCFYTASYIDLYSFYSKLLSQVQILKTLKSGEALDDDISYDQSRAHINKKPVAKPAKKKPIVKPTPIPTPNLTIQNYLKALTALETTLKNGLANILAAVKANAAGSADKGAMGLSIYYPHPKYPANQITSNYRTTVFATQSKWLQFISDNRGA
jgi:hypothetical protein